MYLIGIDIGKNNHCFSIVNKEDGTVISKPTLFANNQEGFDSLIEKFNLILRNLF